LLVAGCSSGGGASPNLPPAAPNAPATGAGAATASANAQVQITIPAPPAASALRRVAYVSPATQSLSFQLATGQPIVVALTAGTPGCATTTNGVVCTANVPLPVGANQQFTVNTYASTNGSGTSLSTTKVTASIVSGQANPIALTLGGIPKSITLIAQTTPISTVASTTIPVTVAVKDASANTIIGSAPFSDANGNAVTIALADSDTSGATVIRPATLTAPGTAGVVYDGYFQPTAATISASGTGLTTATAPLTFAAKTIAVAIDGPNANTLGANRGPVSLRSNPHAAAARREPQAPIPAPAIGSLVPTGNASAPYALGTHITMGPSGFQRFFNEFFGMATAPNGDLALTEHGGQFGIFDAGSTPTWPAASTIVAGSASQVFGTLALGPGGKVYAAILGGFEQINPATGAVVGTPVTTLSSQYQQLLTRSLAVGPDGTVYFDAYVAPSGGDEVLAYTPSGSGFVFARAFWTGNSNQTINAIYGLAVDATNHVYVSDNTLATIDVVPASSTGNVLPSMVYVDTVDFPEGEQLVVDRSGNILWGTGDSVSIFLPNTGSIPPGGTDPTTPWIPTPDTPVAQILMGNTYSTLTFGPGS